MKKGSKLSEEHKQKLLESHLGKHRSLETKQKLREANLGKKLSDATKQKIRKGNLGKHFSLETRQKISKSCLGRKCSLATRQKLREANLGKTGYWKGKHPSLETRRRMSIARDRGLTSSAEKIRKSIEYKLWRKSVFERDNYTCQKCKKRGGELNADHIKCFALHPKLRLNIDNGRTLCISCHKTTDTWGWKSKRK